MTFISFIFKHIAWLDLIFNIVSLVLFYLYRDTIGYKIQTFGLVYVFILAGLIGLTALSALVGFLSPKISIILGCLFLLPSVINLKFVLILSFPK